MDTTTTNTEGGWIPVNSPGDENTSDEEFITRNLLRELVEQSHQAPEADPLWWAEHHDLETLVLDYAGKVSSLYEASEVHKAACDVIEAELETRDGLQMYWQDIRSYVEESEHEGAYPKSFKDFKRDLALYIYESRYAADFDYTEREYSTEPERDEAAYLLAGRARVIQNIVEAEENFEPGTIARTCLDFFKWVQDHTDTFDPVMCKMMLESEMSLKHSDDTIMEFVRDFLSNPS